MVAQDVSEKALDVAASSPSPTSERQKEEGSGSEPHDDGSEKTMEEAKEEEEESGPNPFFVRSALRRRIQAPLNASADWSRECFATAARSCMPSSLSPSWRP